MRCNNNNFRLSKKYKNSCSTSRCCDTLSEEITILRKEIIELQNNSQRAFKPKNSDITSFINLDNYMSNIEDEYSNTPITLSNDNFKNGTYRIRNSGYYKLTEDIFFNPNPSQWIETDPNLCPSGYLQGPDWLPTPEQTSGGKNAEYPIAPYGGYHLGFFAAITIEADNVILDLNGFTISQSIEHYLQQRFFSVIELASTPFIPPQGPSNFGMITYCSNVKIMNGSIGLAAHSGIHGNNMTNIIIENLNIFNYEQAGISLNGAETVYIRDITIDNSSMNVFVNSNYSQSRFIRSFLKNAFNSGKTINILGVEKNSETILDELQDEMNCVYDQVVNKKISPISELYSNPSGIIDGNIYGIALNVSGVLVNGFVTEYSLEKRNNNVLLQNISICNLKSHPKEVVALLNNGIEDSYGLKKVQTGPVGDVFKILNVMDENSYYKPNVLANAQCFVSKHKIFCKAPRASVEEYIYNDWINSPKIFDPPKLFYVLGVDSMNHSMKGSIALFLSGSMNTQIYNVKVDGLENSGPLGNSDKADQYTKEYLGNISRGIAVVASKNIFMLGIQIKQIKSKTGTSFGIQFINNSDNVYISNYYIEDIISCKYLDSGPFPNTKGLSKIIYGNKNVTSLTLKPI